MTSSRSLRGIIFHKSWRRHCKITWRDFWIGTLKMHYRIGSDAWRSVLMLEAIILNETFYNLMRKTTVSPNIFSLLFKHALYYLSLDGNQLWREQNRTSFTSAITFKAYKYLKMHSARWCQVTHIYMKLKPKQFKLSFYQQNKSGEAVQTSTKLKNQRICGKCELPLQFSFLLKTNLHDWEPS